MAEAVDSEIAAFVERQSALVEKERSFEVEESQALVRRLPATQLQRLGLALTGVRVTGVRAGLGGKQLVTVEAAVAGDKLPATLLRTGDIVSVGDKDRESSGVVWQATEAKLVVALAGDDDAPGDQRCTVRKLANDTTYKRILGALRDLAQAKTRPRLHAVLFGAEQPRFGGGSDGAGDSLPDESLNESQRAAVRRAVAAQDVALIHGPPGTGKTHTVVAVIRRLAAAGKRVLVCGPSNVAVDNIVERLARHRVRMVRLGHPARFLAAGAAHSLDSVAQASAQGALVRDVRRDIDAALAQVRRCRSGAERRALYAQIKDLRRECRAREARVIDEAIGAAQVVLATLSAAGGRDLARSAAPFDAVVIDEATQAVEGECWIAAARAPALILAGDHHQLPPTLRSPAASQALAATMFERVRARFGDAACCMLATQYRMHADIMAVSAQRLYGGRLAADPSVAAHLLSEIAGVEATDDTAAALVLIDTAGTGMAETTEAADDERLALADVDSKCNRGEADLAARHVAALVAAGLPAEDIAVISPYNAQVRLLRTLLRDALPALEIGSVDGFQGREKEAVVLSLVRSNPACEIGFLADYRRINVAVTRARRHLCVVADSQTVARRDPFLRALFAHLEAAADLRYPE
ncbi:hypothetical protein H4R21_000039 [Coemansia helicoidea]|uniref:Uncharacterized protein n=1 Tax=Coemansia helicoidea TaxID=1286919 RepID=A0ACC1LHP4_9FUNG|nr:hypothetical protein H4R21_000039 [Coemansia helicoidea]